MWAGLWSLPEFESAAALETFTAGWPGQGQWLPAIEHALTHFDWTLQPLVWTLPAQAQPPSALPAGRWVSEEDALALGLAAPVRRLLEG